MVQDVKYPRKTGAGAAAGGGNPAREIEDIADSTGFPVVHLLPADFTAEPDIVSALQPIRIGPKRVLRIVDPDGKVRLTSISIKKRCERPIVRANLGDGADGVRDVTGTKVGRPAASPPECELEDDLRKLKYACRSTASERSAWPSPRLSTRLARWRARQDSSQGPADNLAAVAWQVVRR